MNLVHKTNPVAKALRSPHLRHQVVADKKRKHDRQAARAQLKQGKYDITYDLPSLLSPRNGSWAHRDLWGYDMQKNWLENYYRTKARFCREAAAFARGNLKTEADPVKRMGILAVIQFMTGKARRYERDALLAGRWGPLMRRLGVRPIPPLPYPPKRFMAALRREGE